MWRDHPTKDRETGHHICASFARTSCIFVAAVVSMEVRLERVDGHDVVAGTVASQGAGGFSQLTQQKICSGPVADEVGVGGTDRDGPGEIVLVKSHAASVA